MPVPAEIKLKFQQLVENGLDFLEKSSNELETEQKYSIIHFSTGLELLLKARLFAEHWSLIADSPHGCSWPSLERGEVPTLAANKLCTTITSVIGTPLGNQAEVFAKIFKHRNRVVHWIPDYTVEETAAEQCRAWYHLNRLLSNTWHDIFVEFFSRIGNVHRQLLKNRNYLQVRFDDLENRLKGPASNNTLIDCPACRFRAGVIESPDEFLSEFECWVCKLNDYVVKMPCNYWLPFYKLPAECICSETHSLSDFLSQENVPSDARREIMDLLDPAPLLGPKEQLSYESPRAYCAECSAQEETVVPTGDSCNDVYVCVECGAIFQNHNIDNCEWCNDRWAGAILEHSATTGCGNCDGLVGHHMAKDD